MSFKPVVQLNYGQGTASTTLKRRLLSALVLPSVMAVSATHAAEAPSSPAPWETPQQHEARMQWFRDAKFGMFIHWGLYSQLAGEWKGKRTSFGAEWIQEQMAIPSSEYMPLAKSWNPSNYNPRDWVRQMKAAGIRYICITSKHHDGFCLWPTKLNDDWNISITPKGEDLLKPLADACREEGVKFCLYHSVMDWHHPDWTGQSFNDLRQGAPDKERFKKEYLYPQMKELFTNYGNIGMLWLDGTWDKAWTSEDGRELEAYLRKLQPSVVLNNRSGYKPPQPKYDFHIGNAYSYTFAGDYISPEGEIPPTGLPGIDWETCQTMQPPKNWGYNRLTRFRPFAELLRELVDVSSKGGNLLLNTGPNAEGEIVSEAASRLKDFATWMAVNAESIHGTTASPFEHLPFDGRCTRKGGRLYLHVFDWPTSRQLVVPVKNPIKRAWLLADPEKSLTVVAGPRGSSITLPDHAPDAIASVVAVEIDGNPTVILPAKPVSMGKPVTASAEWPGRTGLKKEHVTDGKTNTIWAGPENSREGWLQVDLGTECLVDSILLSEGKTYTRCRKFSVQAEVDGQWKTIASGEGIGALKELAVQPVKARLFRLAIATGTPPNQPDGEPVIAEFRIFAKRGKQE